MPQAGCSKCRRVGAPVLSHKERLGVAHMREMGERGQQVGHPQITRWAAHVHSTPPPPEQPVRSQLAALNSTSGG
jgi:hypothetical protein